MPIYLDGQIADLAGDTLGAVIDAVKHRLAPVRRILVDVSVDGENLSGETLDQRLGHTVGGQEVYLESADPRELAGVTLQQVRVGLQDARKDQLDAADLFQQDQRDKAMQRVGRAIEAWQHTQQAVLHTTMLVGIDLNKKIFEDHPMTELTDALLAQLKNLRDLIADGDTVALADSLTYEWPSMTDRWDKLLGELIGWIEREE